MAAAESRHETFNECPFVTQSKQRPGAAATNARTPSHISQSINECVCMCVEMNVCRCVRALHRVIEIEM